MEIAEFLLARIAEDEDPLRAAVDGELKDDFGLYWVPIDNDGHKVGWHPTQWLAECEAKRRIVALHFADPDSRLCDVCGSRDAYPCTTLRLLALPYADHPDYQPEWSLTVSV